MTPLRWMPLGFLLVPGLAQAQKLTWRASGTAGLGVNAVQADSGAPQGVVVPGGPFLALTPALDLAYDRPRVEQLFEYAFTFNLQFDQNFQVPSGNATYANRAAYQAHVYVTPTVDLLVGANVTQAPLNVVAAGQDPSQTPVAPAPPGYAYNVQGVANEAVTKQFSEAWSGTESGAFTYGVPVNIKPARQDIFAGTLGLAASRAWTYDTGTLTGSSTLAHFTEGVDLTGVNKSPAFDQSVNTLVASWRHEWTQTWATQLDGGGLQVVTLGRSAPIVWQPTGAATIDFTRPAVAAELAYLHGALLNVYLAEVQLVDEVAARVAIPVGRDRDVTASATAAYEHTRAIGPDGKFVQPEFDLWLADAGVAWAPHRVQNFTLGARVSLTKQDPTGPAMPGTAIVGFVRETVLVTVTYGYPTAATAGPAYLAPIYRAAPVTQRDFENVELRAHPNPEAPEPGTEPSGEAPSGPTRSR